MVENSLFAVLRNSRRLLIHPTMKFPIQSSLIEVNLIIRLSGILYFNFHLQ